jgi:hypothetical protein
VQKITGDLIAASATQLTALSANQLTTIGGTFNLNKLVILSTLDFSSLTRVTRIQWVGLPALQSLSFAQVVSQSNQVSISNTQLNSLPGLELTAVDSIDVNNNPHLTTVNMIALTNITNSLSVSANGRNLEVAFPTLSSAGNITLRSVSSFTAPSLSILAGAMGLYSDTMQSRSLPELISTGGSIAIVDCLNLQNLSIAALANVGGGILLSNNTQLKTLSFLNLKTVVGAIDFAGTFDK